MSSTDNHLPKAVLYYSPQTVWSAVVLLALEEKGYGADELDFQVVDLVGGENYNPTFLRLNPKATVPTLVVPLEKTLSEDVESRYKAITESKAIVEFLDKSRSTRSRTHTTSSAPAPILTPATVAFMDTTNEIIELLHSETASPDRLSYRNARNQDSLRKLANEVRPLLAGKEKALSYFLGEAQSGRIQVSEKTKSFWSGKRDGVQELLDVFSLADKPENELGSEDKSKRDSYFAGARMGWENDLKRILGQLDKAVIGPYALGEQFSVADLHLAAWLAAIAKLVGASASDDGETMTNKLVSHVGEGVVLAQVKSRAGDAKQSRTKLGGYWDAIRERGSWKKVYGRGLF